MLKKMLLFLLLISFSISYPQLQQYTPEKIVTAIKADITPPLRDMPIIQPGTIVRNWKEKGVPNKDGVKKFQKKFQNPINFGDPAIQTKMGELNQDSPPIANWEAINNINGVYPPDTRMLFDPR